MIKPKGTGKRDISIDNLISENNKEKDELRNRLYDALPKLLDYVFSIEIEKGYCPTLTSSFKEKQDSDESPLEYDYMLMRG